MAKKKRNRKNRKRDVGIPCPGPLLSVLIAAAIVSLGYLQICGQCEALGEDIGELEARRSEISNRLNIEKSKWSRKQSIAGIKKGLAKWEIEMELPPPERIVVVRREKLLNELVPAERSDRYASYVARNGYE